MWVKLATAALINFLVAGAAYKKKSLSLDGAVAGFLVGLLHSFTGNSPIILLFLFFTSSSYLTKRGHKVKSKVEDGFKEGGQRNWLQVFCNGGPQGLLCLLYLIYVGVDEKPVDFWLNFTGSSLLVGIMGGYACANGDTWASECGILSEGKVFLVTGFRTVERGTNGGMSLLGTMASFLGGLFIGTGFFLSSGIFAGVFDWRHILFGGLAGFLGSLIDSILGATFQYSGWDPVSNRVVNQPGPGVRHISGVDLVSNHTVNLISVVLTAFGMTIFSHYLY